jgi:hypothetical protein
MPKTRYYIPKFKLNSASLCNNAVAVVFSNAELTIDDRGWTVIPYGMWRHPLGWQQFGMEQATAICNAFAIMATKLKRAIVGLPIFNGHPDEPEYEAEFPDKTEYGQLAEMEARADGLAMKLVLSNDGANLTKMGLKYISPRWNADVIGEKNGEKVWAPREMLSVGLVKKPNIPNMSLVNKGTDLMQKKDLIALFGLAADSTDEAVTSAVAAAAKRPTTDSLSNAQTEATTAKAKVTELETSLTNAAKEKTDLATALANEQKAHRTTLVNVAFKEGRITEAQVPIWQKRLDANFADESKALTNMAPVIKVKGITDSMSGLITDLNARLAKMTDAERAEWSKVGVLTNDDMGGGAGDDLANVKELCNLVTTEMKKGAYDHIKDPNQRYAQAMKNVLAVHKKFTDIKDADNDVNT